MTTTDVLFLLAVAFLLASWYVTARRRTRAVILELLGDLGEATAQGLVTASKGRLHRGTVDTWLLDLESEGIVRSFPVPRMSGHPALDQQYPFTYRYALVPEVPHA